MLSQVGMLQFLVCMINCVQLCDQWTQVQRKDCKRDTASKTGNKKSEIELYNQVMPRYRVVYLHLFRSSHRGVPVQLYWCNKTEKVFLDIPHKIHKENTCVSQSLFFLNLLKKRLWHCCFPVIFAKFLRTPFSQNTSCSLGLGDYCFFLLIFLSPSFNHFVASYTQYVCFTTQLFFMIALASYLSSLLFFIPTTELVSSFAFALCPLVHFFLPTERCQGVLLIEKCKILFLRLLLARQNPTGIFRIILNIIAFYHSG